MTCPIHDICTTDCTSKCAPKNTTELATRIEAYNERLTGMFFKAQFRYVWNDVNVEPWQDWKDLKVCTSKDELIELVENELGPISDVSWEGIGLYQPLASDRTQIRFVRTNRIGNEWSVGISSLLGDL